MLYFCRNLCVWMWKRQRFNKFSIICFILSFAQSYIVQRQNLQRMCFPSLSFLSSRLKQKFTQKRKFCHCLLTLMLVQTCMNFFLLLHEHKRRYLERMSVTKQLRAPTAFHSCTCFSTMEVNGWLPPSLKYLKILFSAEERNSYRFGTTWG